MTPVLSTAGTLDMNDLRAHLRRHSGGNRLGHYAACREYPDALQRAELFQ
jgi:hypothetical protein